MPIISEENVDPKGFWSMLYVILDDLRLYMEYI